MIEKIETDGLRTYFLFRMVTLLTWVVSSASPLYSTPLVSGGITSLITGNSPWSLPPTIRKLKSPSLAVTRVTSFISLDQCEGFSTMGLRVREWDEDLRSISLLLLLLLLRLLALWRLGVIGRLRLCLNIVTDVTVHLHWIMVTGVTF